MSPGPKSAACVAVLVCMVATPAVSRDMRVAVVKDGPALRQVLSVASLQREIVNVAAPDVRIQLSEDERYTADWSLAGASAALDRALSDKDVDVVITLGVLSSQQAARRASLPKPVIAALAIDPILQDYPLAEGRSGRHNFAYVADFQSVANEVRSFHEITGFTNLAAVVDESLLDALPRITTKASELATLLKVRISLVRAGADVNAVLGGLPQGVDAVYVTPLRFTEAQLRELAQGLVSRRLPSFSVVGRSEVEQGLLMSTGGAERDVERLARRVVLM